MAAAMPPSAITVCALPSSDLHTRAVRAPWSDASMAARRPAPPAPMTTTSNSWLSYSAMFRASPNAVCPVDASWIPESSQATGACCPASTGQTSSGSALEEPQVEDADPAPQPEAQRRARELVDHAAAEVPAGVARQRVQPQQGRVEQQDQGAEAHAEAVGEAERPQRVPGQDQRERQGQVEEVAVHVLQDQREAGLAAVAGARVRHGAGRRRPPERAVVGLA